jgi:predicted AlkP superfamily phosphohydrolase/phosphomutase
MIVILLQVSMFVIILQVSMIVIILQVSMIVIILSGNRGITQFPENACNSITSVWSLHSQLVRYSRACAQYSTVIFWTDLSITILC